MTTSPPDGSNGRLAGLVIALAGMSYAPEHTGIAPYTAGMAEVLARSGARVDVLAGMPHYPSWRVRPEDRWRLRRHETLNGVHVHRARHFVPATQTVLGRLVWEATFLLNGGAVRFPVRPDLVLGVTPSLSGAVLAARAARQHRVPLGLVVQDLVGKAATGSGIVGGGRVASSASAVESRVLRQADLVAVVSDQFRPQMTDYGIPSDRVRLLRNWTHIATATGEPVQVRRRMGWADDDFVVLHTGNMGLKQGLQNVLAAARRLTDDSRVRVVLMGDGNQRAALEASGRDIPNLSFVDPVAGDEYPDVLRAADVLLVNELPTVGDMSLPSKLTSYFSAGRPVVAAVSADGACARELAATDGAGLRVEPAQPEALAAAVRELRDDPQRRSLMGVAGRAYADDVLSREAAERAVLSFVDELRR